MTTLMAQQDFLTFMEAHLRLASGEEYNVTKKDEWCYEVKTKDNQEKYIEINFGNVYENYVRTSDINVAISFLKTQVDVLKKLGSLGENINLDEIYPVFRLADFNHEGKIKDTFSEDLSILYVEDNPKFVSFLTKMTLPKNITEDELSEKAFDNLKKQGWVDPIEVTEIGDYATLYVFEEPIKQYQAQFMVREMFEQHLGDYFHFTMPTRDITIVLKFKKSPDDFIPIAVELDKRLKMHTIALYQTMQNPLSHKIHSMSNEGVRVLG